MSTPSDPQPFPLRPAIGLTDPEDHYEFEDREEVRAMGRMSDESETDSNPDLPFGYDPEDSATH